MPFARPSYTPACPKKQPRVRRGAVALTAALSAAGALAGLAAPATAAPAASSTASHSTGATPQTARATHHSTYARKNAEWHAEAHRVIAWAAKQNGKPYRYGAAGPNAFDCSGLVMYVFAHSIHRSLPHNAAQQYYSIRHINRAQRQPGDLVFVDNGGYISHVGIYAGHNHWWVAPHTGTRVYRQKMYRAHMLYGRAIPWPKS